MRFSCTWTTKGNQISYVLNCFKGNYDLLVAMARDLEQWRLKSMVTLLVGDHLNDLQWHRVLLERLKGKTTVTLDNQSTSRSTIKSKEGTSLHIESPMYFGGLPPTLSANSVTQPSVLLLNRFVGCMAEIEMFEFPAGQGKRRKDILDQSKEDSKGIAPACTDMCEKDNICQNNGTCLNKFTTIACDCTATGFRGKTCEEGNSI